MQATASWTSLLAKGQYRIQKLLLTYRDYVMENTTLKAQRHLSKHLTRFHVFYNTCYQVALQLPDSVLVASFRYIAFLRGSTLFLVIPDRLYSLPTLKGLQ